MMHGTTSGYSGGKCRCDYCKASKSVYNRKRNAKTADQLSSLDNLQALIREAAETGAPLPEAATPQQRTGGRGWLVDSGKGVQSDSSAEAAADAHQARLRAVERAQGSPAVLAILAVSEYTSDDVRAIRYARTALALAAEL